MPRLFIVRYKRNTTEDNTKLDKKPKGIWDSIHDQELDPASQLVARFNGSDEITEVRTLVPTHIYIYILFSNLQNALGNSYMSITMWLRHFSLSFLNDCVYVSCLVKIVIICLKSY